MPDQKPLDAADDSHPVQFDAQGQGWAELVAPNRPASVDQIEQLFESHALDTLPEQDRQDLKFALREICQNAFEWGNQKEPHRKIRVAYCLFADKIVLKISDEGEGFDPAIVPDPKKNLMEVVLSRKKSGKRPGGFGIFLVKKIMDEVVYNEKGNVVLLTKHLGRSKGGDV
ncbi:MAG: ATP-binding protein [Planctomycetes bacterium]|nr:ATP-binding protein [Planctomycetota bacterium]